MGLEIAFVITLPFISLHISPGGGELVGKAKIITHSTLIKLV